MPTVIVVRGWRLFFYSNEGREPVHVHARKGESECKIWLRLDIYDIEVDWSYNISPRLRKEIRRIVFDHFDLIVEEWNRHFGGGYDADN